MSDTNEIDVDAIYDQVMQSNSNAGWDESSQSEEATETTPGEGANASEDESTEGTMAEPTGEVNEFLEQFKAAKVPIKWGGEEKLFDGEKVIQYAQQGYDYNVKNRELKQQRQSFDDQKAEWESEQTEWKGKVEEYSKYDEFLKNNPQVFQEIQNRYNQHQSGQDPNAIFQMPGQMNPMVQDLQAQVQSLQDRLAQEDQVKAQQMEAQKEAKLDDTISGYKEKYSSFDRGKQDEFGYNLEQQVMNHAIDKGIKDFKAAANDYLFEEHLKVANLSAQEKAGKKIQAQKKLGLGEVRGEPMRKMPDKSTSRAGNYNDAIAEIASEYGIKDLI
jgi:hypothetical protein